LCKLEEPGLETSRLEQNCSSKLKWRDFEMVHSGWEFLSDCFMIEHSVVCLSSGKTVNRED